MNKYLVRPGIVALSPGEPEAARRWREERGPASRVAVERREAPAPFKLRGHAPSCQRRKGGPCQSARGPAAPGPRRLPALHPLVREGEGKMGKGDARRPKMQKPGRRSVG
jgi:hypothetical protein